MMYVKQRYSDFFIHKLIFTNMKPTQAQLKEWIDTFHAQGFIVLPNILTPEQCAHLRSDLDKALEGTCPSLDGISMVKRIFERSQHNLDLFAQEPIVTFAEQLIGDCNGEGVAMTRGIRNANTVHVIHNNSFKVPAHNQGLINNAWHQDDTPHILSLDGQPLTNVRLNVLAFTVNYYLTDVTSEANGPTQVIPKSHLFGVHCNNEMASQYADTVHHCLGKMGTAVCFNNQTWHRGSPNTSDIDRYITQITYAKRLVGHKYDPFMNYIMPEYCYKNADTRMKRLLGFLGQGAYN
jgi:ectoine hydroxylase-related dioxygenase (phytanoyl-CoA dioxygenase family)